MLLKKAENLQGYLKAGILGFAGSGKSFTAGLLAIGLANLDTAANKSVAFVDTENGADYLIPQFNQAGIEALVAKTRAYEDLLTIVPEAEKHCDVLIVDSITHIWRELCRAYCKKKKITKMLFQHWHALKEEWQTWADLYVNSQIHIIVCGRAGWIYDFTEQDEDGKRELIKTGTKMKVETEFGFEPSLLLEMERVPLGSEPGAGWTHRCHVLKDRTDMIDGGAFDDPDLTPFLPVLSALNLGGKHLAIDTTRTSEAMFEDGQSRSEYARSCRIALEEIEETMKLLWAGTTGADKKTKIAVAEKLFGTKSWTAIKAMPLEVLLTGSYKLKQLQEGGPLGDLDQVLATLDGCPEQEPPIDVATVSREELEQATTEAFQKPDAEEPKPQEEPAAEPELEMQLIDAGAVWEERPAYLRIALFNYETKTVLLGKHQTKEDDYFCSECREVGTDPERTCEHLDYYLEQTK